VVVATEETIDAAGADRLDQLLALVPNVQQGSGEEGAAIRGQDSTGPLRNLFAFLGGTRPRVTLQVDGRAVSYYEYVNGSPALWDVKRVEIFRSPQTTTQGRNSIAGAIFIETNDPTFEWGGRGRVIIGDSKARHGSAMVTGPLIQDQLAIRVSGDVRLARMASDIADAIAGADVDRDDYGSVRVKLLFEPKALPDARLVTTYAHTRSQSPQFEAVRAPFRERRSPLPDPTNGVHKIKADSLTAQLGYRLGGELYATTTLSYGNALIRRFGLPGLGRTRAHVTDASAEALLKWQPEGPVALLAGVHHLTTRQNQFIDITGLKIGVGDFRDRQASLGLFGEARWRPTAPLAITAGLRYQRDRQKRQGAVGIVPINYDEDFEALLPKISVAYDLTPSTTAGMLLQRAYNPGGTSISLLRRVQDDFQAEALWNYEAFVRSSFAGGRGTLSTNLFYNDISDAQRQQTVPVTLSDGSTIFPVEFANAPAAKTYGLELEVDWRFGGQLSLRGGVGLLSSRVVRTVLRADPTRGKSFQRAPLASAAATVDWQPTKALRLSAQLRHHSGYFSDDANTRARRIEASTIADLRAAYTAGSSTLFGYVRNAFDSYYLTYLFSETFGSAGDPREVGIGLEMRF
jgi:outer membrane receptor protein involved in Fe transport